MKFKGFLIFFNLVQFKNPPPTFVPFGNISFKQETSIQSRGEWKEGVARLEMHSTGAGFLNPPGLQLVVNNTDDDFTSR